MPRPTKIKLKKQSSGDVWTDDDFRLGVPLDLKADGTSADASNPQTAVLIRVFYRVGGIPHAVTLFNGLATPSGSNFDTGDVGQFFRPTVPGHYIITALAWDNKDGTTGNRITVNNHKVKLKIQ